MTDRPANAPSPSDAALDHMRAALVLLDEDKAGVAAIYLQLAIDITETRRAAARS